MMSITQTWRPVKVIVEAEAGLQAMVIAAPSCGEDFNMCKTGIF